MNNEQLNTMVDLKCKLMGMLCDLNAELEEDQEAGSVSLTTIKAVSNILAAVHYIEEMEHMKGEKEEEAEIAVGTAAVKAANIAAMNAEHKAVSAPSQKRVVVSR